MAKRSRMTRRSSKRSFSKGAKIKSRNNARPMRGGLRI